MTNELYYLESIDGLLLSVLQLQDVIASGLGVVVFVCGFCVAALVLVVGAQ